MNKFQIFVLLVILGAATVVGYTMTNPVQINNDISLEQVRDCETIYWNETEKISGNCSSTYTQTICDEPFNVSCRHEEKSYTYACEKDANVVEKSKEVCIDKGMDVYVEKLLKENKYSLDYSDWGKCSYTPSDDSLVIICDSKNDGNADGMCQPGESCISFIVTKNNIVRMFKNSRNDFVESDPTFYQEKIDMEVKE
jgi:hypothetical protein